MILLFLATIATAISGDVVSLTGPQPALVMVGRSFDPPVTIRGGAFPSIRLVRVSGVKFEGVAASAPSLPYDYSNVVEVASSSRITLDGLTVTGPGNQGRGISVRDSSAVTIRKTNLSGLGVGVVLLAVKDAAVRDSLFTGIRSDGIDIADSHGVTIERNVFTDFAPFDPDHPDAIQMWSIAGKAPQSDIAIRDNVIACLCQGITQFDHAQGGSDRVSITGNFVMTGYPHGIALYEARNAAIADNVVRTLPVSPYPWPARINVFGGSVTQERNSVR